MRQLSVVTARKGKLITKTGFKGYDVCLNTYVGCQFGCQYCYVRFFIKDKEHPWGEFLRIREHVESQLPRELDLLENQRLVIGTMTDPYQPQERASRVTRKALEIIQQKGHPIKVGIFTRSPIVVEDGELIRKLPRARVHFSITPFERDVMQRIEGIPVKNERRWKSVQELRAFGIRIHINVAPAIPILSDSFVEEFCEKLRETGVEEFFVDPMQAYTNSFDSLRQSMLDHAQWPQVESIMMDKAKFAAWKEEFKERWITAWKKGGPSKTLAIWCDHVHKVWTNMETGEEMSHRIYGDDLTT